MATDYFGTMGNSYPFGYQKQYPTRVISGYDILELGPEQSQTLIGHTISYCNELESLCERHKKEKEEYFNELVEHGFREIPKTAEEIAKENNAQQQAINMSLLETIQKLSDKIDRIEKEDNNAKLGTDSNGGSESGTPGHSGKSGKGTK